MTGRVVTGRVVTGRVVTGRAGLVLAAALALLAPAATRAGDAAGAGPGPGAGDSDIRCLVVGGALAQNPDPELQKLGAASLLYFWGRIQGRGDTANIDARVIQSADAMTAADIKAQAKTCAAMMTAASQDLQSLGAAVRQHFGDAASPPAP